MSSFALSSEKNKPGTWIIDVKGDQDFHRYGGLDPHTVPRFYRAGGVFYVRFECFMVRCKNLSLLTGFLIMIPSNDVAGRVLGLPRSMRIDFEKTRALGNKGIVMRTSGRSTKPARYSDLHATWRDQSHEYKRITRAKAEELAMAMNIAREDPSFISLDVRLQNRQDDLSISDDSEPERSDSEDGTFDSRRKLDYRDIHGKSVHKDEDEDLLQTTSDQEEEGAESALDVLRRRRMMLDGELRKNPKQPEKWLEFIAVEDEINLVSSRRSVGNHAAHSAGHAGVKLSIFERALQSNPTNEHLLLEYMTTCRHSWEPAKVLSKWDELLQSQKIQTAWPGLWIKYLDFRQRHFLSFSVKNFARVLEDALDRLGQLARSTWLALQRADEKTELQAQLVKVESVMVHVIARTWTFLKQAGYIERAQGIIQGQVEFIFNMPPSLTTESWEIQIGSLEEYWDSELPRFGEKDAKGWTHYVSEEDEVTMENQLDQTTLPKQDDLDEELLKAFADNDVDRYQYSRWATLEKDLNRLCWFPIRTTEDLPAQLENDPYGIIIFDDIRPFIVSLYTAEARLQFVDCMFNFLGLPVNSFAGSNESQSSLSSPVSRPMRATSFYNPYFHDSLLLDMGMDIQSSQDSNLGLKRFFPPFENKAKLVERVMKEIEWEQQLREPEERDWNCVWNLPIHLFPHGPDTIFGRRGGDSSEEDARYRWANVSSHEEVKVSNKVFIRNTFQQLIDVVKLPKNYQRGLSLYHLMFEALDTLSASKGQKLAKKYLKGDRMDLELWNGYAQAELTLGRISEARKVYSTALSMYKTFPAENQARAPLIIRYFAELEWAQGRPGVALVILVAFAEGVAADIPGDDEKDIPTPTPTRLIKARQFYSQKSAQLNLGRLTDLADNTDAIGSKWFEPALDLIVCFAWFEYLSWSTGVALEAGIKVFEDAIQQLDFRNPDCEIEVPVEVPGRSATSKHQPLLFSSIAVSADLEVEKRTTKKRICTGAEAEMVWVQMAKLVYFHSLQAASPSKRSKADGAAGFQPRNLRHVVQAGLQRFPNCTVLQSLFFWTEAKQRLHGRVRTWVNEQVMYGQGSRRLGGGGPLASKAPMWIFGLFYELWQQEPYNVHVVRSLLESALESAKSVSSSSSPNLWLVYIELELRESVRQQEDRNNSETKGGSKGKGKDKDKKSSRIDLGIESSSRAKQLVMRAVNDCPWCKDLYMLAFEPRMRKLFSIEELDQLYQTMLEKEIRVRHEIPERVVPASKDVEMTEADKDSKDVSMDED
ncbi:hypothetical protein BGZ54_000844 [Gamsiella multidivaricata]|nr:hypothetical protein BGZ54_000844 [Gamsiella multidivaricata]